MSLYGSTAGMAVKLLINQHEDDCELRPFQCQYCKVYESTYSNVNNDHRSVCTKFPISCPKKCLKFIERECLIQHLENECQLNIADCEFSYAGCKAKVPQKDMSAHLSGELYLHLSMVSAMNKRLLQENSTLSKRLGELKAMMIVNGSVSDRWNKELTERLVTVEKDSKALVAHLKSENILDLPPIRFVFNSEMHMYEEDYVLQACDFYSHIGGYRMQLQLQRRPGRECVWLRICMVQGGHLMELWSS